MHECIYNILGDVRMVMGRSVPALFEFPELRHPNFLMSLSVLPLYTLLVVHKHNDLPAE
jgi:hypothetical protein